MLKSIKKAVLFPIVIVVGVIIGVFLMLIRLDTWADFKAELKSLVTYYWELY